MQKSSASVVFYSINAFLLMWLSNFARPPPLRTVPRASHPPGGVSRGDARGSRPGLAGLGKGVARGDSPAPPGRRTTPLHTSPSPQVGWGGDGRTLRGRGGTDLGRVAQGSGPGVPFSARGVSQGDARGTVRRGGVRAKFDYHITGTYWNLPTLSHTYQGTRYDE